MVLADFVLVEDVIAPIVVTIVAALIVAALVWLVRTMSKFVRHVLPHFDPALAKEAGIVPMPERIKITEESTRRQEHRLDAHLVTEELSGERTTAAIAAVAEQAKETRRELREDIKDLHNRIDEVLTPGNPEVRRG